MLHLVVEVSVERLFELSLQPDEKRFQVIREGQTGTSGMATALPKTLSEQTQLGLQRLL